MARPSEPLLESPAMSTLPDFAKLVPGFDFLQGLMKTAGAAGGVAGGLPGMSGIGQWIAPTLNPEELEKRIDELRTVQFWLEQNAKLLGTAIQALEVQRMTLSTLKTMNLPMADLREAMSVRLPEALRPAAAAMAPPVPPKPAPAAPAPTPAPTAASTQAPAEAAPPAVDPLQWWGALTQQFTEIATQAMKDHSADAARQLAGAMVKQSLDAAGETLKKAVAAPARAAATAANLAAGLAGSAVAGTQASVARVAKKAAQTAAASRAASGAAGASAKGSAKAQTGSAARPARKTARRSPGG
jgi:hypothetical protein